MAWFQKRDTDKRPGNIQEQPDRHLRDHLTGVVKFDCPHCKHETLAIESYVPVKLVGSDGNWISWGRPALVCIVCGKTFRKGEPAYEEVKESEQLPSKPPRGEPKSGIKGL